MSSRITTADLAVLSALVLAILGIDPAMFVAAILPVVILFIKRDGPPTGDTR